METELCLMTCAGHLEESSLRPTREWSSDPVLCFHTGASLLGQVFKNLHTEQGATVPLPSLF